MLTLCLSGFYFGYIVVYLTSVSYPKIKQYYGISWMEESLAQGVLNGVISVGGGVGCLLSQGVMKWYSRRYLFDNNIKIRPSCNKLPRYLRKPASLHPLSHYLDFCQTATRHLYRSIHSHRSAVYQGDFTVVLCWDGWGAVSVFYGFWDRVLLPVCFCDGEGVGGCLR